MFYAILSAPKKILPKIFLGEARHDTMLPSISSFVLFFFCVVVKLNNGLAMETNKTKTKGHHERHQEIVPARWTCIAQTQKRITLPICFIHQRKKINQHLQYINFIQFHWNLILDLTLFSARRELSPNAGKSRPFHVRQLTLEMFVFQLFLSSSFRPGQINVHFFDLSKDTVPRVSYHFNWTDCLINTVNYTFWPMFLYPFSTSTEKNVMHILTECQRNKNIFQLKNFNTLGKFYLQTESLLLLPQHFYQLQTKKRTLSWHRKATKQTVPKKGTHVHEFQHHKSRCLPCVRSMAPAVSSNWSSCSKNTIVCKRKHICFERHSNAENQFVQNSFRKIVRCTDEQWSEVLEGEY